jgi:hypothetical protein
LSRAGVTDKATQRKLNVINVSLFTPALLFSKVSSLMDWGYLFEKLINDPGRVLVNASEVEGDVDYTAWVSYVARGAEAQSLRCDRFVVVTSLSAGVAWTLAKIFKLKRSQRWV